ncbi:MAG: RNA-binding transcriptional accessory protein, partial [Firmicutes bacterium]|nr:RNA-binding transcriptional accessory protein [Bacillota bacterium]
MLQRVEDLYKPYKQKRATRASKAKERGLEPLAVKIYAQMDTEGDPLEIASAFVDPEKEVNTPEEALQGALDIIAEMIADDPDITAEVREKTQTHGVIVTEAVDKEEKTVYENYYDFAEGIAKIPNHRVLAINRGEKEKKLKVKVSIEPDTVYGLIEKRIVRRPVKGGKPSIYYYLLLATIEDAYKRLMAPSIEREMR